jgi:gentisate 1,2-dioxygenase
MTILDRTALLNRSPDYYARLASIGVEPLWAMGPWKAAGPARPYVWKFKEVMPALEDSRQVYTMGEAEEDRRGLNYMNPNGWGSAPTYLAGIQMIFPGESAAAHRHTSTACRFIMSGDGGFTVQDGQRFKMEPGDLILTTNWILHDHGNDGKEPTVWMDYTDKMYSTWGGLFREEGDQIQEVSWKHHMPEGNMRFAASGMLPVGARSPTTNSPQLLYPWAQAEASVRSLLRMGEDPYDCAMAEYVNPVTGGHCTSSQAHYLQLLTKGFHGKARRRTENAHCFIFKGSGKTIIEGREYRWEIGDTLMIPSWSWYEHVADEETFINYSSDLPGREAFGIHREELLMENGGHQKVTADLAA